jgi:hypothetical protein
MLGVFEAHIMNLPLVNEDCCFPMEREIMKDDFLEKSSIHLNEVNPTIAGFVEEFASKLPECCARAALLAAYITYRFLENQAEADKMTEELS